MEANSNAYETKKKKNSEIYANILIKKIFLTTFWWIQEELFKKVVEIAMVSV
jgi:hypothetical protein